MLTQIRKIVRYVHKIGIINLFRTVWFNLRYFPFSIGIKLPVILYQKLYCPGLKKGCIIIENPGFMRLCLGGSGGMEFCSPKPTFLSIAPSGRLIIKGANFHYFRPGATINIAPEATLEIGNCFSAANDLRINVIGDITIGNNNMWSFNCLIIDSDSHYIYDMNGKAMNPPGKISFGDNVWLGSKVTVLKNIKIADGCIIGSNSVVTRNLSEKSSIYAGYPARLIKSNIYWKRPIITKINQKTLNQISDHTSNNKMNIYGGG